MKHDNRMSWCSHTHTHRHTARHSGKIITFGFYANQTQSRPQSRLLAYLVTLNTLFFLFCLYASLSSWLDVCYILVVCCFCCCVFFTLFWTKCTHTHTTTDDLYFWLIHSSMEVKSPLPPLFLYCHTTQCIMVAAEYMPLQILGCVCLRPMFILIYRRS